VTGGEDSPPFGADYVPVGLVWCQVLYAEESDGCFTLDLVTLEPCPTRGGAIDSGAPFTIRSSVEPAARTRYDAIVSRWSGDGEIVVLAYGVTDACRWICLRSAAEQLMLQVA
jgi:hypothetical protein